MSASRATISYGYSHQREKKPVLRVASTIPVCVLAGLLAFAGCSADSPTSSDSEPAEVVVPEGVEQLDIEDVPDEIDVEASTKNIKCGKPEYESVVCTVEVTNTTDKMGQLSSTAAFRDKSGKRLSTDSRYQEYVAPGETYVAQHYGPEDTVSADVIELEFDEVQEVHKEGAPLEEDDYILLPTSDAKIGKCKVKYGNAICTITITNSSKQKGEINTTVAFYDAKGIRIDSETRYQEKVQPGETYDQDFYGPKETKAMKVLEIELEP